MKINVTARDIRLGVRKEGRKCPIARALRRRKAIKGRQRVHVAEREIYYYHGAFRWYVELPREARSFVYKFDRKRPVKPFSFEVDL